LHQKYSVKIDIQKLWIILGAHNKDNNFEIGRQIGYPEELIIHEKWNPNNQRYDNDIALIRFIYPISFTNLIQPICLFNNNFQVSEGKVAGWGVIDDYDNTADVAKIATLRITDTLKCVINNPFYDRIASENTFCAESTEVGVCKGDSGSGFYIIDDGKAYLKGLVSSTISTKCTNKKVALYTDIYKYHDFIKVNEFQTFLGNLIDNFYY
jgi:secreted trypsin-like serine protease